MIAHMGKSYVYCDSLWTRPEGYLSNWAGHEIGLGARGQEKAENPVCTRCNLAHAGECL